MPERTGAISPTRRAVRIPVMLLFRLQNKSRQLR